MAYDSGKGEIFVTSFGSGSVSAVDVISDSTNTVVATITTITNPCAVAYDSGKKEMFIGGADSNEVYYLSDSSSPSSGSTSSASPTPTISEFSISVLIVVAVAMIAVTVCAVT